MVCTSCIRGTILTNGARIVIFLFHEEDKDERKRYEKRYGIRFKFIVDSKLFELFILEVRFPPRQSIDFFFLSLSLLYRINGIRIVFFFFQKYFIDSCYKRNEIGMKDSIRGGKKKANFSTYLVILSLNRFLFDVKIKKITFSINKSPVNGIFE